MWLITFFSQALQLNPECLQAHTFYTRCTKPKNITHNHDETQKFDLTGLLLISSSVDKNIIFFDTYCHRTVMNKVQIKKRECDFIISIYIVPYHTHMYSPYKVIYIVFSF